MERKIEVYQRFGAMLDCSRGAVLKVSAVKQIINALQKMGYNALELYTEDTFEVEGEPYFGYLRGRYTGAEIKEMDSYAAAHGIELIPCIQTLAHFTNSVKLPRFAEITDVNDILLIDDEKTYEFLDKIFASLAKNFTSRNVHIGMDEAHMVGLGKYLDKHGYCDRFELLNRHLQRVNAIAKKYGFTAHMWSDMFFRLAAKGDYYMHGVSVPQEVREKVPEDVSLVYWDYYHTQKEDYDAMIESHKEFGRKVWFAGGVWTWLGFNPRTRYAYEAACSAMRSVRQNGIKNVLITAWGDDGGECSFFSVLQVLYAARRYADGEYNDKIIADEFEKLFGISAQDLDLLELPDIVPDMQGCGKLCNPSKYLLYGDPFLGISDRTLRDYKPIPYAEYAERLATAKSRAGEYAYLFDCTEKLCRLLDIKAYLGVRTRAAYRGKDKNALTALIADYEKAAKRAEEFFQSFRERWHKENKPFGFEVHCVRLGGLTKRLAFCKERLQAYVSGETRTIEELEENVLPYYPESDENEFWMGSYRNIVSAGGL